MSSLGYRSTNPRPQLPTVSHESGPEDVHIIIDNSNLFIEGLLPARAEDTLLSQIILARPMNDYLTGKKFAAKHRKLVVPSDPTFRLHVPNLIASVAGSRNVKVCGRGSRYGFLSCSYRSGT